MRNRICWWCIVMAAVLAAGGARAQERAAGEVPADDGSLMDENIGPVDVLYPEDFRAQGYTTLPQVLANLVPSFVYPEPALADGTDHTRPASLHGLAPDHMVVLLDGKRRHPAAWLHRGDTFGRGSVGVDLSVIPLDAVKRVEILRQGASARYGSGAVAGVINVVLKDAREGGSVTATFGQYRTHFDGVPDLSEVGSRSSTEFFLFERGDLNTDDGDGDTLTVSAHGGFTLFDDGYLDITAEFRDQDRTNRSGFDPRSIYPDLPNGDFDTRELLVDRRTSRYGNPDQQDVKLLTSFGLPTGERSEFYGHIGYTARNAEAAELFVPARSTANIASIHPDGYLPLLDADDESRYFTFGFRGRRLGWDWDLSYTQDEHEMDFTVHDSVNASLGDISPTEFEIGNYEGRHEIIALDLDRSFEIGAASPLMVSGGLEYRSADYENEFGERAGYIAGGATTSTGELRPPGSQGYLAVRPVDDFDEARVNLGAYLQFQTSFTDSLDTLLGVRYDDEEEDSFASGQLAVRWRTTDRLVLHGAVSRDFRMPSPAQTYFLETRPVVVGNGYEDQGTYPAEDPVARALGAEPLDAETALNVSAGFRLALGESAWVSVDGYQIDLDDRIVLSNELSGPQVDATLGAAGLTGIQSVRYFFNGIDTRTRGIDVAGEYVWQSRWGPIHLGLGLNVNNTDVTGRAATPAVLGGPSATDPRFGARDELQLERWTPDSKLHLSARWQGRRLGVETRLVRYGEVVDLGSSPADDQTLDTPWVLDVHARYQLTEHGYMGMGIYNMFDEYPGARPRSDSDPVMNRLAPYSNYSPFGFNGRFAYLRLGVDLDQ